MATKYFHNLKNGELFIRNGQTYKKVRAVKQSCCKVLYNAVVAGLPENKANGIVVVIMNR